MGLQIQLKIPLVDIREKQKKCPLLEKATYGK